MIGYHMSVPAPIISNLVANNYTLITDNEYTHVPAYVKRIRNLSYNGSDFHNCSVLIEVRFENYMTFRIMGYHVNDDSLRDLTGIFRKSVNQIIEMGDTGRAIRRLQSSAHLTRSQYAL